MDIWKNWIAGILLAIGAALLSACAPTTDLDIASQDLAPVERVAQRLDDPAQAQAADDERRRTQAIDDGLRPRSLAPVPVARPVNPRPVYTGAMVSVGDGVYCPDFIAAESVKTWSTVASMPNTKGREAIARLKGLPREVRDAAVQAFQSDQISYRFIGKGQRICSMAYSDGLIWSNIRAEWSDRRRMHYKLVSIAHGDWVYHVAVPPKATEASADPEYQGCDNDQYWVTKKL